MNDSKTNTGQRCIIKCDQLKNDSRLDRLTVLHVVLPTLVTVPVLLRKRDAGSSIGWMGLAWLSPLPGSALCFLLGVNRVTERARAAARSGDPPSSSCARNLGHQSRRRTV